MFCSHKYREVKDGYQHCEKCGKAISAPEKICNHKWVNIEILRSHLPRDPSILISKIYHDRCESCGELKRTELS